MARTARDARRRIHPLHHRREDRVARRVFRVNDAPLTMPAFAGKIESAPGVAIEAHVELVEQELPYGPRTLAHELVDGGGISHVVARLENVALQFLRIR